MACQNPNSNSEEKEKGFGAHIIAKTKDISIFGLS